MRRGSVMYFALLQVVLKRQTGTLRMSDLLLITLIADPSQKALTAAVANLIRVDRNTLPQ
jgi:hypothetical protein